MPIDERAMATGLLLATTGFVAGTTGFVAVAADSEEPVRHHVAVTSVVVDVVVTDRDGNHISGLTADDFELSEAREAQVITDVSEVVEGAPTTPVSTPGKTATKPAGRRFVILIDEFNLNPNHVSRSRRAAQGFLQEEMGTQDQVAVMSLGSTLRMVHAFSSDAASLTRSIEEAGHDGEVPQEAFPGQTDINFNPDPGKQGADPSELADGLSSEVIRLRDSVPSPQRLQQQQRNSRLFEAFTLIGKTLLHMPGRKTLVLFSSGFETLFEHGAGREEYRRMIDVLNRANVAIYPVDPDASARTPGDARTTFRQAGPNPRFDSTLPPDAFREATADRLTALKILAADTGGRAVVASSDLQDKLKQIAQSTSSYYMLSYTPSKEVEKAGFRKIKVKVRQRGARVLVHKGFFRDKPFHKLSKRERTEHLREPLLSWVDLDDVPVELQASFFPAGTENTQLLASVILPPYALSPATTGPQAEILFHVEDRDGDTVMEEVEPLGLSPSDVERQLTWVRPLELTPGRYWARVVVRDELTGFMGTGTASITAPRFHQDRPVISTLHLMARPESARLLSIDRAHEDAYWFQGRVFHPQPHQTFDDSGPILCHFRVGNLQLDPETQRPRLVVLYTVTRDEEVLSQLMVHYKADAPPDPEAGVPLHFALPLSDLGAGSLDVEVIAYDVLAARGIRTSTSIVVLPSDGSKAEAPTPLE